MLRQFSKYVKKRRTPKYRLDGNSAVSMVKPPASNCASTIMRHVTVNARHSDNTNDAFTTIGGAVGHWGDALTAFSHS